ncbi:MAG: HU family DNA-binding protein, partial [Pseudomonadota bacterium]
GEDMAVSRKTTSATTAKRKTRKPKTASPAKAPITSKAPVVVDAPTPVVAGPMLRKKELIEAVVDRSGLKKKDVKPAVEATLAVLGAALQDGRELNLQPMGKVKIKREKKLTSGRMLSARIRQNDGPRKTSAIGGVEGFSGSSTDKDAAE